jgi:hypothetical protein
MPLFNRLRYTDAIAGPSRGSALSFSMIEASVTACTSVRPIRSAFSRISGVKSLRNSATISSTIARAGVERVTR